MLITHGILFTGKELTENLSLRTDGEIISEVGAGLSPRPGEKILDLQGDYLLPGFVDVHIHACQGQDTMEGESAVRAMSRSLRKMGVAAFCPTTMSGSEEDAFTSPAV